MSAFHNVVVVVVVSFNRITSSTFLDPRSSVRRPHKRFSNRQNERARACRHHHGNIRWTEDLPYYMRLRPTDCACVLHLNKVTYSLVTIWRTGFMGEMTDTWSGVYTIRLCRWFSVMLYTSLTEQGRVKCSFSVWIESSKYFLDRTDGEWSCHRHKNKHELHKQKK